MAAVFGTHSHIPHTQQFLVQINRFLFFILQKKIAPNIYKLYMNSFLFEALQKIYLIKAKLLKKKNFI